MSVARWWALACLIGSYAGVAKADPQFDQCEQRSKAASDIELGPCVSAWQARAEARLRVAWKKALADAGGVASEQGRALLDEQRAWIVFKDKACRQYDFQTSGTLARFHDSGVCRAEIIEDRISELSSELRGKSLS